ELPGHELGVADRSSRRHAGRPGHDRDHLPVVPGGHHAADDAPDDRAHDAGDHGADDPSDDAPHDDRAVAVTEPGASNDIWFVREEFTESQRAVLAPHFTELDGPVFALTNQPEVVKGALFARYSRSPK